MLITKSLQDEITEMLQYQPLVQIPASLKEYLSVAQTSRFKIEYHESEIYTMGLASFYHELVVANLAFLFNQLYFDSNDMRVLGSNTGVQIQKFEGGYYMPDVMLVKGKPIFAENSTAIIQNPYIIVEVLSPATYKFDIDLKLPEYKQIESLQQIFFVNPQRINVSSYTRSDNPRIWLNQDFYSLDEQIAIGKQPIPLASIYKKVEF